MADEVNYPISFYKAGEEPTYAHNATEADAKRADGWTSDGRSLPKLSYPRLVYHQETGVSQRCEDAAHEDELKKQGFGRTRPEVGVGASLPPAIPRESDFAMKKIGELMEQNVEIRLRLATQERENERLAESLAHLNAIVESLQSDPSDAISPRRKPGPKPKNQDTPEAAGVI